MQKVLSLFTILFIGLSFFLTTVSTVSAQSICPKGGNFAGLCNLKAESSGKIIGNIVQIMLIVAIIIALLFFIYGGIRWISSGGDKGKVDQARGTLTAAVVGLVIALLSFFILNIVTFVVTGKSFTTFTIPTLLQ